MPLLEVAELTVRFGGNWAVNNLSLEVNPGSIVGLIGPNGAGKTTAIDAITGFVPSGGGVTFDGAEVAGMPPHARARRGLARTWQGGDLFDDLDVRANLEVASRKPRWSDVFTAFVAPGRGRNASSIDAALGRLGLEGLADARTSSLSHGQRKLVGVARALVSQPKLVMLDEPAAGLDETETAALAGTSLMFGFALFASFVENGRVRGRRGTGVTGSVRHGRRVVPGVERAVMLLLASLVSRLTDRPQRMLAIDLPATPSAWSASIEFYVATPRHSSAHLPIQHNC